MAAGGCTAGAYPDFAPATAVAAPRANLVGTMDAPTVSRKRTRERPVLIALLPAAAVDAFAAAVVDDAVPSAASVPRPRFFPAAAAVAFTATVMAAVDVAFVGAAAIDVVVVKRGVN